MKQIHGHSIRVSLASHVLNFWRMTGNLIVMPGSANLDLRALQAAAMEFGWTVRFVHDLSKAASGRAVLFYRDALGPGCSWLDAVRQLKLALPEARLIVCHGLAEAIDWPELCDAGAFHALGLPLSVNEVRKSLGFVLEAEKRLSGLRHTRSHQPRPLRSESKEGSKRAEFMIKSSSDET
jgi:DNA-binding NtrC family response regulator